MSSAAQRPEPTLFGHPTGLYTLFFAEMWERFSYYGMRALLVFYMMKGFLGYGDSEAYTVYGAYTALVYMTPFFGGMLADRVLGARRAVVIGGVLMALGQLLLAVENVWVFFTALALLILGNGFFKPNISTIVGSLYAKQPAKRAGGFVIFYMGINFGAAMSPLLCSVVAERYGWEYGFGLAAFGMLTGLAVFVVPGIIARVLILGGAVSAGIALIYLRPSDPLAIGANVLVAVALVSAAVLSWVAIGRGGLPPEAGGPPKRAQDERTGGFRISAQQIVLAGTMLAIPIFVLLVSGFSPLTKEQRSVSIVKDEFVKSLEASSNGLVQIAAVVVKEVSKPAGLVLMVSGLLALAYVVYETVKLATIPRRRMYVVLFLTFFSMLFWSFFEQAGSSVNNFTDRNVHRMSDGNIKRTIASADVGSTLTLEPTQWQLGYHNGDQLFTIDKLNAMRKAHKDDYYELRKRWKEANRAGETVDAPELAPPTLVWKVAPDNVGMHVATMEDETPAAFFQSVNPIFIMLFGLPFTALWALLAARGWEPSTPLKFALGLFQLGLGFGAFWYGARVCDERGMVALSWLFLGYFFQTTGELCLSPVGLAMLTRLSPARLVSTVMGVWFLATAFSQFLAAIIAQFTSVTHNGGDEKVVPPPVETAAIYGEVFGKIAIAAMISSVICFTLVPLLKKWMHDDHPETA